VAELGPGRVPELPQVQTGTASDVQSPEDTELGVVPEAEQSEIPDSSRLRSRAHEARLAQQPATTGMTPLVALPGPWCSVQGPPKVDQPAGADVFPTRFAVAQARVQPQDAVHPLVCTEPHRPDAEVLRRLLGERQEPISLSEVARTTTYTGDYDFETGFLTLGSDGVA
jgi:hypothetical protein